MKYTITKEDISRCDFDERFTPFLISNADFHDIKKKKM